MTQYFHFTLGPVQSFVGQARRTRDFWAGSFLLSWLSGVAMLAVIKQGGKVLFPQADEDFLHAIEGKKSEKLPKQGSIPNRFKASVNEHFSATAVTAAVQQAWQQLAAQIYQQESAQFDSEQTAVIWQRQVEHFWEMSWVLTDDEANSSGLDQRKSWRSQYLPAEPGIKCALIGDWQELSGVLGVSHEERKQREEFWKNIFDKQKNNRPYDFDSTGKEPLCAIAYIKRRFDRHFANFKASINADLTIHGWQVPSDVPSVAYMAAVPWFAKVLKEGKGSTKLNHFIETAREFAGKPEYKTNIRCIREAETDPKRTGIDGNLFHEIALENPNIMKETKRENAKVSVDDVKNALKPLLQQYGKILPFYAIFFNDGR